MFTAGTVDRSCLITSSFRNTRVDFDLRQQVKLLVIWRGNSLPCSKGQTMWSHRQHPYLRGRSEERVSAKTSDKTKTTRTKHHSTKKRESTETTPARIGRPAIGRGNSDLWPIPGWRRRGSPLCRRERTGYVDFDFSKRDTEMKGVRCIAPLSLAWC